jgi:hypothetical protein
MAVAKIIPPLAAGCSIVYKPAPETPLKTVNMPAGEPPLRPEAIGQLEPIAAGAHFFGTSA